MSDPTSDPEGAGGPPWAPVVAKWLLATSVLLLLPRQWFAAGIAMTAGIALSLVSERRGPSGA